MRQLSQSPRERRRRSGFKKSQHAPAVLRIGDEPDWQSTRIMEVLGVWTGDDSYRGRAERQDVHCHETSARTSRQPEREGAWLTATGLRMFIVDRPFGHLTRGGGGIPNGPVRASATRSSIRAGHVAVGRRATHVQGG